LRSYAARKAIGRPAERASRPDLVPDPALPDDTRLWAALQSVGGGTWGGCVADVDTIIEALSRTTVPFTSRQAEAMVKSHEHGKELHDEERT
jgi:hypothetical protein